MGDLVDATIAGQEVKAQKIQEGSLSVGLRRINDLLWLAAASE